MRINIELLGNSEYRIRTFANNPLQRWVLRRIGINVSHMSQLGECGWIVYKDVTEAES